MSPNKHEKGGEDINQRKISTKLVSTHNTIYGGGFSRTKNPNMLLLKKRYSTSTAAYPSLNNTVISLEREFKSTIRSNKPPVKHLKKNFYKNTSL